MEYSVAQLFLVDQTEEILGSKAGDIGRNFYHYTLANSVKSILQVDERGNKIKRSKLGICMDLLKNNKQNILDHIDERCDEEALESL